MGMEPSVVTLSPQTWTPVPIDRTSYTRPVSVGTGSSATTPGAEILHYPGSNRPSDAQVLAAGHSVGPGICYLPADPDQQDLGLPTYHWLYYNHASETVDVVIWPLARDSEFSVYAHASPGWAYPSVQTSKDMSGGGKNTLLDPNPHRKFLSICMTERSDGYLMITFGGTSPSATRGIRLNAEGAEYSLFGDSCYRGLVEGRAYNAVAGQFDISILEGV